MVCCFFRVLQPNQLAYYQRPCGGIAAELHLSNSRKKEGVACKTTRMRICVFSNSDEGKIGGKCKQQAVFPSPEGEECSKQTC